MRYTCQRRSKSASSISLLLDCQVLNYLQASPNQVRSTPLQARAKPLTAHCYNTAKSIEVESRRHPVDNVRDGLCWLLGNTPITSKRAPAWDYSRTSAWRLSNRTAKKSPWRPVCSSVFASVKDAANSRKITATVAAGLQKSLDEFDDLSGIVKNRMTCERVLAAIEADGAAFRTISTLLPTRGLRKARWRQPFSDCSSQAK